VKVKNTAVYLGKRETLVEYGPDGLSHGLRPPGLHRASVTVSHPRLYTICTNHDQATLLYLYFKKALCSICKPMKVCKNFAFLIDFTVYNVTMYITGSLYNGKKACQ
jgi:hypothetical protein